MEKRKQLIIRSVVSGLAGLVVAILTIIVVWRSFAMVVGFRPEQWRTQRILYFIFLKQSQPIKNVWVNFLVCWMTCRR